MNESSQVRSIGSAELGSAGEGLIHIEGIVNTSHELEISLLPESYLPCQGTWDEFVGDAKRYLNRMKASYEDKLEDTRDAFKKVFRKKDSQTGG